MEISVQWDNEEKTILRVYYPERWIWPDLYDAVDRTQAMLNSVSHPVKILVDMSKSMFLPTGSTSHVSNMLTAPHANATVMVVVGASGYLKSFLEVFSEMFNPASNARKILLARTLEEGYELLNAHT